MGELFKLPYNAGQTAEREPPERYLLMIKPSELNDDTLIRAMDVLTVIKHHANSLEKESYLCDESRKAQCINLRVMEARVVLDVVWDGILEYGFNRKPAQEDK